MGFYDEFMLTLTGLEPDTNYYFKVYVGEAESLVRNFKTQSET